MLVFRGFMPNIAVEWLARLFHIQVVPIAALRPVTGHPEIVRGFPQFPEENAEIVPQIMPQPPLSVLSR
jgi:hypothetical protein